MNNLGLYRIMTTAAKKVGGPGIFLLLCSAAGYGAGRSLEAGVKAVVKGIQKQKATDTQETGKRYSVEKDYHDEHGLRLRRGDRVRILETDGDSYLIEKLGDDHNPYFISGSLFKTLVSSM